MSVFGVWCGGEGGGGAGLAGDGGEEEVEEEKEVEEEESSLAYRLKQLSPGLGGRERVATRERETSRRNPGSTESSQLSVSLQTSVMPSVGRPYSHHPSSLSPHS